MSFLDDAVDVLGDAFDVVHGGVSAVTDSAEVVGDVLTGDLHGAVVDGTNVLGDLRDVLQGMEGLGADLGRVPKRFADNPLVKLSDSPPIEAAQLAIDGMKATTGSGDPEDGAGLKKSADLLAEVVEQLVDAKPHEDRWNGDAAEAYAEKNDGHRRKVSGVEVADRAIAGVLSAEADQVVGTRKTLDDVSQYLYDFGLSTSWMNLVPGGRAAKLALDAAAAAAGLAQAGYALEELVRASLSNAATIRGHTEHYQSAATEKLSLPSQACAPFVLPGVDLAQGHLPERLDPEQPYEVPEPIEPPEFGPPATPYGAPGATAPPRGEHP